MTSSFACLRVSTTRQDVQGQRLAILEYARRHHVQIDEFIEATAFIAIEERIRIEGKQDIQTTLFALFAEVERELISERNHDGLAKAGSSGKKLGRPKGSLGVSRLDGKKPRLPSSMHASAITPAETARCSCRFSSRTAIRLPLDIPPAQPCLFPYPQ